MTGRRVLADLLVELAGSMTTFADVAADLPVRPCSLSLSLPIDLRVATTADGPQIVGDVPLYRTRTDFDTDPARLDVEWRAVPYVMGGST